MVKLQEAENQIITNYEVYAQRPYDSDLLIAAIETHQALLGVFAMRPQRPAPPPVVTGRGAVGAFR